MTLMCNIGVGNGSRVAAAVGTRCRGSLAGFMLMGYPLQVQTLFTTPLKPCNLFCSCYSNTVSFLLINKCGSQEPLPSNKGGPAPDSVSRSLGGSCLGGKKREGSRMIIK